MLFAVLTVLASSWIALLTTFDLGNPKFSLRNSRSRQHSSVNLTPIIFSLWSTLYLAIFSPLFIHILPFATRFVKLFYCYLLFFLINILLRIAILAYVGFPLIALSKSFISNVFFPRCFTLIA